MRSRANSFIGCPGHSAHQNRQQRETGIAVEVLGTGLEVQRSLAAHQIEDVILGLDVVGAPAGQPEQVPLVPQPAGVVEQVADRDRRAEVGHLGNVLADVVI